MDIKKHVMGPHTYMRAIYESKNGGRPKKIFLEVFTDGPASGTVFFSNCLERIRLEPGEAREMKKLLDKYLPEPEERG